MKVPTAEGLNRIAMKHIGADAREHCSSERAGCEAERAIARQGTWEALSRDDGPCVLLFHAVLSVLVWIVMLACLASSGRGQESVNAENLREKRRAEVIVFGGHPDGIYRRMRQQSQLLVELLDQEIGVDAEQIGRALHAAAEGQIARLQREGQRLIASVQQRSGDPRSAQEIENAVEQFQARLSQGIWRDDSLVRKVLNGRLDEEQQRALKVALDQRQARRFEACVYGLVADLSVATALSQSQREQLVQLMTREVPVAVPPAFGARELGLAALQHVGDDALAEVLEPEQLAIAKKFQDAPRSPLIWKAARDGSLPERGE